jgi:hypothetical protein
MPEQNVGIFKKIPQNQISKVPAIIKFDLDDDEEEPV